MISVPPGRAAARIAPAIRSTALSTCSISGSCSRWLSCSPRCPRCTSARRSRGTPSPPPPPPRSGSVPGRRWPRCPSPATDDRARQPGRRGLSPRQRPTRLRPERADREEALRWGSSGARCAVPSRSSSWRWIRPGGHLGRLASLTVATAAALIIGLPIGLIYRPRALPRTPGAASSSPTPAWRSRR